MVGICYAIILGKDRISQQAINLFGWMVNFIKRIVQGTYVKKHYTQSTVVVQLGI